MVTCPHCKYIWETKSKMFSVSCPRCGGKVKTGITIKEVQLDDRGKDDGKGICNQKDAEGIQNNVSEVL